MLRGELHNRGSAGCCEACGEIFPCPAGLAIYEAVKRELEHPTPPHAAAPAQRHLEPTEPFESVANLGVSFGWGPPAPVHWEDLDDREDRCRQCLHWWVSHGSVADEDGCMVLLSSMAERTAMAEEDRRLLREGVPPEVAGPRAYRELRHCGCQERPASGSEWDKRLAREAAYQAQHYDRKSV
jgi:hypothetical protein